VRHVTSVAGRELRSLFVSPVAYGVLSLFSILAGVFFILDVAWFSQMIARLQQFQALDQLAEFNLNDGLISEFYGSMSVILLFLLPGITMGSYAAEKSNGTEELLLTSPLTMWDIVLGKFLAGAVFVFALIVIVGMFPGLLFVYGDPELGKTASGLLGLLLTGWTYVAIGGFASSVTRSQIIAFLITFVVLLTMLLIPAVADFGIAGTAPAVAEVLRYLSAAQHFEPMLKGLIDTADLAYFAVMIGSFLLFTKATVESVRWR
jgi:ABC-2 type transport system permease protein